MLQRSLDRRSTGTTARRIEDAVSAYLSDSFLSDNRPLAHLDPWSQRRITVGNMTKVSEVLDADDPIGACDANLVREIHAESQAGVFLATPAGNAAQLQRLSGNSDMSGRLFQHMPRIAPVVFAEDLRHFDGNIDLIWAVLDSRYYRSKLRADVSELVLMYLLETEESIADRADDLRRTFYTWQEDKIRRQCGLSLLLDDAASRRLDSVASGLLERGSAEVAFG